MSTISDEHNFSWQKFFYIEICFKKFHFTAFPDRRFNFFEIFYIFLSCLKFFMPQQPTYKNDLRGVIPSLRL